ncbi:non-homologous end-joining DNA ligase [Gordonia sp. NPDC058843]|uniref:non-homologous end-joining DNA ligase n=1 Tax=Gordonia sp. NPDC058843 TaxID=3346648 RepID=UPI0036A16F5B
MSPMLATPGPPPSGSGWSWEMKWDGQRCLARVADDAVQLLSRNRSPITSTYPEIAAALPIAAGGRDLVVDGEIVALDAAGRPSFSRLQRRMHTPRPGRRLLTEVPAAFYLFDVLELDGADVAPLPYLERRGLLDSALTNTGAVQVTPYWPDSSAEPMLELATTFGLEGVVAKRATSRYLRGQRSPSWVKVPLRLSAEVIVCGWTGGPTMVRSLLLGGYRPSGELIYLGEVGTGFTQQDRGEIADQLAAVAHPNHPFTAAHSPTRIRNVRWVRPVLVGTIEYREITRRLRHPSWKGFRSDKTPDEVIWPELDDQS